LLTVVLSTWAVAPSVVQPKDKGETDTPQRLAGSDWKAEIGLALKKTVSVDFKEQPLTEVAAYLRECTGAAVLIDRRALDDVGMAQDTPITGKFSDMSLHSVLRHLLRPLELTWDLRDGALLITTPEEAEGFLHTAVYEVVDLVKPAVSSTPEEYDYDSLIDLITSIIVPQTWGSVGGPGAIEAFRGGVVVSQTADAHDQLRDALALYRKAKQLAEKHSESPPTAASVDIVEDDPAMTRITPALVTPMTFDLSDSPLHDVVEFLAAQTKSNVILDARALDDVGIGADEPVTFQAENIQLRHALNHMLRDLDLTWIVRDQALVITTPEEAESFPTTRAYPVADLLGKTVDIDMFGAPMRPADHGDLVSLINSTVAPSTWDEVGGPGSIGFCPHIDVLLVSQEPRVHEEIADLLAKVRQHLAESSETSTAPVSEAASEKTTLVIYHVPTVAVSRRTTSSSESAPAGIMGQFGGAVTPGPGAVGQPGERAAGRPAIIPEQELLAVITELIEPGSWSERDDVYSRAIPGRLIIRHTDAVHRQISRLLGRLGGTYRSVPATSMGGGGGMGGGFF